MLWPLWSEFLLSWARTRRYWFNTLANLGGEPPLLLRNPFGL